MPTRPIKCLVISNMYPSHKHPGYGIFVHSQVESVAAHSDVVLQVVASRVKVGGVIVKTLKYLELFARALLRIIAFRPDVVHIHYLHPTVACVPLLSSLVGRSKFVVTLHGSDFCTVQASCLLSMAYKWILRTYRVHCICVGPMLAKGACVSLGICADHISTIPCGVDTSVFFPYDKHSARAELGLLSDGIVVLYVGPQTAHKGYHLFLALAGLVATRRFQFVHVGPAQSRSSLHNLVHMGEYSRPQVALAMNAADVTVIPSIDEGFGLVAAESLCCGTPVVASNRGGLKTIVVDGVNGRLVEPDIPSIASGLVDVLANHHAMREQALLARDIWDQRHLASRVVDLYRQVTMNTLQ